ncbi:hypothetical protein BIW11_12848 [Tropilaelaps mercedesae]|uniref:Uncharacterized protein n=1 Tax=Tropilaelaps mercedesae TaxID=418985 RepID=A0A1V9X564_9ACAR|nr:hypothetical protein BIW11_12848 [Tropilaelaps mercedesae]
MRTGVFTHGNATSPNRLDVSSARRPHGGHRGGQFGRDHAQNPLASLKICLCHPSGRWEAGVFLLAAVFRKRPAQGKE